MKNNESILLKCRSGTRKKKGTLEGRGNGIVGKMKSRTVAGRAIKQIEYYPIFVRAINSLEKCAIRLHSSACPWMSYQLCAQFVAEWTTRVYIRALPLLVLRRQEARDSLRFYNNRLVNAPRISSIGRESGKISVCSILSSATYDALHCTFFIVNSFPHILLSSLSFIASANLFTAPFLLLDTFIKGKSCRFICVGHFSRRRF